MRKDFIYILSILGVPRTFRVIISQQTSKTKVSKLRKEGEEFKLEYAKLFDDVLTIEQKIHEDLAAYMIDGSRNIFCCEFKNIIKTFDKFEGIVHKISLKSDRTYEGSVGKIFNKLDGVVYSEDNAMEKVNSIQIFTRSMKRRFGRVYKKL